MLSKRAADVDQLPLKNLILSHFLELASLCSFLDGNSNCNSSAYHRVVTHTDQEPANCASECIRPMVSVIP